MPATPSVEVAGRRRPTPSQSSVSFTLGSNVENLTLTGSAAINGTGNALANTLIGNDAANMLNGGAGADIMEGGARQRHLYRRQCRRRCDRGIGGGTDTVESSLSYTLGANVENLTLTGGATINGTGNALDNDDHRQRRGQHPERRRRRRRHGRRPRQRHLHRRQCRRHGDGRRRRPAPTWSSPPSTSRSAPMSRI